MDCKKQQSTIPRLHIQKDYTRKGKCYWKCIKCQCLARVTSLVPQINGIEVEIYKVSGVHNHHLPPPKQHCETILFNHLFAMAKNIAM